MSKEEIKETKEENEFDKIEAEEEVPEQEFSPVPGEQESMIAAGAAGTEYDWSKAPEGVKAPPRIDMSGKTVTIKVAKIILPPLSRPWEKTKAGDKEFKYCTFTLHYDFEGQQEFYSGVRIFNRDGKYSHPTITKDRNNQASKLVGLYADFKKKDINEVSLKEFMNFLNSKPQAKIKIEEVINPTNNKTVKKNCVSEFVNP